MSISWAEIKQEILDEYDLNEETFVTEAELVSYINAAIDDIESEIHAIHDKYFETEGFLALTAGQSMYDLPADIYAAKITGVYYNNGSDKYEITPLRDKKRIMSVEQEDDYQYRIVNSTADGMKLRLYPQSREDSAENVTIHYIRSAKRVTPDNDIIDIPEARGFLKQFVVDKAANKERMTPDAPESPALQRLRKNLIDILTEMVPDDNNEIIPDFSYYDCMTGVN